MIITSFHSFWYNTNGRETIYCDNEQDFELYKKQKRPWKIFSYITLNKLIENDIKIWNKFNNL